MVASSKPRQLKKGSLWAAVPQTIALEIFGRGVWRADQEIGCLSLLCRPCVCLSPSKASGPMMMLN